MVERISGTCLPSQPFETLPETVPEWKAGEIEDAKISRFAK